MISLRERIINTSLNDVHTLSEPLVILEMEALGAERLAVALYNDSSTHNAEFVLKGQIVKGGKWVDLVDVRIREGAINFKACWSIKPGCSQLVFIDASYCRSVQVCGYLASIAGQAVPVRTELVQLANTLPRV